MKKIYLSIITLAFVASLFTPTLALAQTAEETDLQQVKCERIEKKLEQKVNHWQMRKAKHTQRWEKIKVRINTIIEKLRAKGFDVTPLEEDREIMQGLVNEMQIAFDNVIAKANEAKANACTDQEAFKTNIEELKVLVQEAKEKYQEMTGFLKNEFIPDIKSFKEPSPTPTP